MELNNNSNSGNKLAIDIISKKDEVKVAGTKKKRNIESYLSDMEDLLIDCVMGDEDVKKVISSSEGEMQTWRGMGITDDEIEKFQKFVG